MFQFDQAEFRYEPFPIGVIKPLMDEAAYREMVESYPPKDLFVHLPKVGHKYTLSEKFNGETYQRFIEETPYWRRLRAWIKSPEFIDSVNRMLCRQHIDLGLSQLNVSEAKKWRIAWKEIRRGRFPRLPPGLRARFEFSMLPADGGHIMPHTDTPKKLITLIVSAMRDGEWDPAFGGCWASGLEAASGALFAMAWPCRRLLRFLGAVQPSEVAGAAALSRRLTVIR